MTREELIARTRQLIDEGSRLQANPSLDGLRTSGRRSLGQGERRRGGEEIASRQIHFSPQSPHGFNRTNGSASSGSGTARIFSCAAR